MAPMDDDTKKVVVVAGLTALVTAAATRVVDVAARWIEKRLGLEDKPRHD